MHIFSVQSWSAQMSRPTILFLGVETNHSNVSVALHLAATVGEKYQSTSAGHGYHLVLSEWFVDEIATSGRDTECRIVNALV